MITACSAIGGSKLITCVDWLGAGVAIEDFQASWRDGLAFCALVHRFRPGAFDFASLQPDNADANLKLAFATAEKELGACIHRTRTTAHASPHTHHRTHITAHARASPHTHTLILVPIGWVRVGVPSYLSSEDVADSDGADVLTYLLKFHSLVETNENAVRVVSCRTCAHTPCQEGSEF